MHFLAIAALSLATISMSTASHRGMRFARGVESYKDVKGSNKEVTNLEGRYGHGTTKYTDYKPKLVPKGKGDKQLKPKTNDDKEECNEKDDKDMMDDKDEKDMTDEKYKKDDTDNKDDKGENDDKDNKDNKGEKDGKDMKNDKDDKEDCNEKDDKDMMDDKD